MVKVDVVVKDEEAEKMLQAADEDIQRGLQDALDDIGDMVRVNMIRQLARQGSIVTATGASSIDVRTTSDKGRAVFGRKYLLGLDEGTPPHTPNVNYRLRAWARQEGWTVDAIVEHIQSEGTDPNPFIEKSVDRTRPRIEQTTVMNVSRRLDH